MKPTATGAAALLAAALAAGGPAPPPGAFAGTAAARAETPEVAPAFGSYLAGARAREDGDFPAALKAFDRAFGADPGNAHLRNQVFLAALSAGRVDRAAGLAGEIADGPDPTAMARLAAAVAEIGRGDLAAAESRLEGYADRDVGRLLRHVLLAWAKTGRGRTDQALTALGAIVRADPRQRVFHDFQAALISEQAGRARQARAGFLRVTGNADVLPVHMVLGIGGFHERAGEPAKARDLYASHLETKPDSIAVRQELERLDGGGPAPRAVSDAAEGAAVALFHVAGAVNWASAPRVALAHARLAGWLDPELHLAHMMAGAILESLGRPEQALDVYRGSLAGSRFDAEAQLGIARSLEEMGRAEEAVELLGRLARRPVVRVDALTGLGDLHRRNGNHDGAAEAYGRAIESLGTVGSGHWQLLFKRGMALERAKRWDRAERDLEHALRLRPDQPLVLNYLGYSWVDQGVNLERALGMLERAVRQRPDSGYIVDSLGWAFYRMKNFPEAVRHLERAVELMSRDPVINDHLGDAYWRVGRHREARIQWRRALSLEPEAEIVPAIREKILRGLADTENDS